MKTCTFLSNKSVVNESELRLKLYDLAVDLIEEEGVEYFFVGSGSHFESVVYDVLNKIGEFYPNVICCAIIPHNHSVGELRYKNYIDCFCPNEVMKAAPEFAENARNAWIVQIADILIYHSDKSIKLRNKRIILI